MPIHYKIWGLRILFLLLFGLGRMNPVVSANRPALPDYALELGKYYLQQQNYPAAVKEFKRFLFLNPDGENDGEVYHFLSQAYAEQARWDPARENLQNAIRLATCDSVFESLQIAMATLFLAQGEWSSAEFELTRLVHFSRHAFIRNKALFLLMVCHIYQYKWEQARDRFAEVASALPDSVAPKMDSLLAVGSRITLKSPRTAKWLSTFLPGAGQVYAGDYRSGLNALALNAATGYVLYSAAAGKQVGDIFIAYMTIFDRYYQGNRTNAESAAMNHNELINRRLAREIVSLLEN